MVPTDVSESTVRRELEVFGDVRAVQMERLREGVLTVHFYDVRDSQAALMAIQEQHMQHQCRLGRHYEALLQAQNNSIPLMPVPPPPLPPPARGLISGRVVWAQFTSPVTSALPDGTNQGTIVIFNLDPQVSTTNLKEIFEAFGMHICIICLCINFCVCMYTCLTNQGVIIMKFMISIVRYMWGK